MFINVAQNGKWELNSPQIMGIINVTQDSFYENSRAKSMADFLAKAAQMISEGANILDIGAQSTRPGAEIINTDAELTNLIPYLEALKNTYPTQLISVDTFNPIVAEKALMAGAHIINDISGGSFDNTILEVVSKYNAGYIAMHITGNQMTMHQIEERTDVIAAIIDDMEKKKDLLASFGIHNWVIDPGFGFGKTTQENFDIVKRLQELKVINLPILLGVSRKSSIYKTLGIGPEDALNGTTVLHTLGLLNGASILRVHDVKEAKQIIQLLPYLQ
ncbi:MAG: dihydropteroate synthase [Chitinophagia bacterium]|jgi:dihydropteroate synthase|nr:dihydropteroate synthase [Chitinophagia bacterium]